MSVLDITPFSNLNMTKFICGSQKDENGSTRTLSLTLTGAQKTDFDSKASANENNSNITLSVK